MPSSTSSSKMRASLRTARRFALFGIPFLLAMEIATRIEQAVRYGAPLLGPYTYDTALYERDQYGVKGKPHGTYEKWVLNGVGLRGPEIALQKPARTLRIATIGASETFGLFEARGHEWPRQLEDMVQDSKTRIEVLNSSIAGLGLRQRIRFFELRVQPLQPDLAILMLEYPSYVGIVRSEEARSPNPEDAPPPSKAGLDIDMSPRIVSKAKDAILPKLPAPIGGLVKDFLIRFRVSRIRSSMGEDFARYTSVRDLEIKAFEQDITDFLDRASGEGLDVILLLPAMLVSDASLRDFTANFPYLHPDWVREARATFPDVARRVAEAHGVPVVDLEAVLGDLKNSVMMDMFHFNDRGAGLVANAVGVEVERWLGQREAKAAKDAGTVALQGSH